MSNVQLGYTQVIDPISFKSIPSGKIYIGEYGTLPNPANAGTWKQAYFVNSDGTRTAASQPIATNAAGYAVDGSGNIKTIQVDGKHSILVQSSLGVTKFSSQKVSSDYQLITDDLSGSSGDAMIGVGNGLTQQSINDQFHDDYISQKPIVIVLTGQSNAAGKFAGGPNPASSKVKTWDGGTSSWGGSSYLAAPWNRSAPNGNSGRSNVGLAFAHRLAEETGRPVYLIFDASGGQSILQWVPASQPRYVGIKAKVELALASTELTAFGITKIDYLIYAQGEEDALTMDMATYRTNFAALDTQFRAESWMDDETPIFIMGMSGLHSRYEPYLAQMTYGAINNRNCVWVNSSGLKTPFDANNTYIISITSAFDFNILDTITASGVTARIIDIDDTVSPALIYVDQASGVPPNSGTINSSSGGSTTIAAATVVNSDYTHFLGNSLWENGYYRLWYALNDRAVTHRQFAPAFASRVLGVWDGGADAIAKFDNLVGYSSRNGGIGVTDNFTGDGATTTFNLTVYGGTISSVTVAGVATTAYTLSGTSLNPTIVFTVAPANSAAIVVSYTQAINGPAAVGSISWGYRCHSDGNYSLAGGYLVRNGALTNYSFAWGRESTQDDSADYCGLFGYQNSQLNSYQFVAGRGHTIADSGGAAVGLFSTYTTAQGDNVMWQVGVGTTTSNRKNGITVRKSGAVEICGNHTATPTQNKDIVLKYQSDTLVRIEMRGNDGVVRGANITIA